MSTYQETIQKSLEPLDSEDIGLHYSIAFAQFQMTMSALCFMNAYGLMTQEFPNVRIVDTRDGDEIADYGGEANEDGVEMTDLLILMGGNDISPRHFSHYLAVQGFLDWLLPQDVPEDLIEKGQMWYGLEHIGTKWNEYAEEKNSDN